MARLATSGFELQRLDGASGVEGSSNGTAPTFDTTTKRSGNASLNVSAAGGGICWTQYSITSALGRTTFLRAYYFITANPTGGSVWMMGFGGTTGRVYLTTSGTLQLQNWNTGSGVQIGS